MFAEFVVDHGFNALYIGCQVIARMFHVRSNSQLFRRLGVVKPILALNVVCLLFFCMEGRGKNFHCGGVAEMASYGSGSEHGAEDILFLCDAQVKHSFMKVPEISLIESAKMAEENGADAIIVTGASTGQATPIDMIKEVRTAVKVPVLAGSGFSADNCAGQLPFIDGAIVGSSFKEGGVLTNPVDENRVKKLMKTVRENC